MIRVRTPRGIWKELTRPLPRHLLVAALIALVPAPAFSAPALPAADESVFEAPVHQHEQRLAQLESLADTLRAAIPRAGQFEQHKYLAILNQPLRSSGEFALAANGDFRWQISTPYLIAYYQRNGELMREVDGQTELVSAAQEPTLYGFFQFFSRIFELDYQALAELFEVYLLVDEASAVDTWQLGLVPRDRRLRQTIARLLIRGEAGSIHEVYLYEPGEDMTQLLFSYPESAPL